MFHYVYLCRRMDKTVPFWQCGFDHFDNCSIYKWQENCCSL